MQILTPDSRGIKRAAEILRRGGLVAFPTETVYGLGCDAFNESAVRRVFEVKRRPPSKPLIIGVADRDEVYELAEVNSVGEKLMKLFFPGPLTLVFRKKDVIPDVVTGGSEKVAVRMPDHEIPLKLIETLRKPVVVPSANITGRPSPTDYTHVVEDLGDRIDAVITGECRVGIESTIVDVTVSPAKILRVGAVRVDELRKHVDVVVEQHPISEYRTTCPVYLFVGENVEERIQEMIREAKIRGMKVATITRKDLGEDVEKYSSNIFAAIRRAESTKPDLIIIEGPSEEHEGLMDRLYRLAGERVIRV